MPEPVIAIYQQMKSKERVCFTLGSRGSVLTSELEEPVIVLHAAQKSEKKVSKSMATLKQNVYC